MKTKRYFNISSNYEPDLQSFLIKEVADLVAKEGWKQISRQQGQERGGEKCWFKMLGRWKFYKSL